MNLKSMADIKIQGDNYLRYLNLLHHNNIKILNLVKIEKGIIITLWAGDYINSKEYIKLTGIKTKILRKSGIYFELFRYRKRYFFVLGFLFFICINIFMSTRILSIKLKGNVFYSDKEVYDFLKNQKIDYFMDKSKVNCTEIEQLFLDNFENISFVSVYLEGVGLNISLKESETEKRKQEEKTACDLVATRSGTISKIYVRRGTPLVRVGDMVEEGDVLISGLENYDKVTGENYGSDYVTADGDIMIRCQEKYENIINRKYEVKHYTGRSDTVSGIKLGNRYHILKNKKPDFELYDSETIYENIKYELSLVPLTYFYQTFYEYTLTEYEYTDEELIIKCEEELNKYIDKLNEKGIQNIEKSVNIDTYGESAVAKGVLTYDEPAFAKKGAFD